MGLRGIEATLPPGFRFYPRDEELVCHYLCKKIANETLAEETMVEVDLHTCEPWQLPDATKLGANEWYFFSFRDRKYATGLRANRATKSGYWKATGKDRSIFNPTTGKIVGMRKTLVFYLERAPNGKKTSWVMHEFRLGSPDMPPKENWVLCRVFHKSKGGPSTQFRRPSTQFRLEGHQPIRDCPSPNIESSTPIQHTMPYKQMISLSTTPHQEDNSPPNSMLNLAVLHCNFFDFPHYLDEMSNSRGGDEYGFLVDLGLEDQSMEDAELMDFLQ